ncbi:unnamed protein product [Alopecurus aequalis]
MAPRRSPKSSAGFLCVRQCPSGCYAAVITADGLHWLIGTFDSAELAARVYDAAPWCFGRPRDEMNFPEETPETAEFLAPPLQLLDRAAAKQACRERMNRRATQIDGLWVELLRRHHPKLLQAERELYATKKKKKRSCDEAGPSTAPPSGTSTALFDDLDDFHWD